MFKKEEYVDIELTNGFAISGKVISTETDHVVLSVGGRRKAVYFNSMLNPPKEQDDVVEGEGVVTTDDTGSDKVSNKAKKSNK